MPCNNTADQSLSSRLKTVEREASEEDSDCGFAPATTIRSDRIRAPRKSGGTAG